jgi:hypothetical protein
MWMWEADEEQRPSPRGGRREGVRIEGIFLIPLYRDDRELEVGKDAGEERREE